MDNTEYKKRALTAVIALALIAGAAYGIKNADPEDQTAVAAESIAMTANVQSAGAILVDGIYKEIDGGSYSSQTDSVFIVRNGGHLKIQNAVITGGEKSAIRIEDDGSTVELEACTLSAKSGAAVSFENGLSEISIRNCTLNNKHTLFDVRNATAVVSLERCDISCGKLANVNDDSGLSLNVSHGTVCGLVETDESSSAAVNVLDYAEYSGESIGAVMVG